MGLGLQNAFGIENAQQGLRQRIIDQLNQQKQQQDMKLADQEMALKQQEAAQRAKQFEMTQADHSAALADRTQAANVTNWTKLAPTLPMDQNVSPEAATMARAGGGGSQMYTPPTMGETESGKPFDAATANPAMNLGTASQQQEAGDQATIAGLANSPEMAANKPAQGFLRALPGLDRSHPGASGALAKLLEPPPQPPSTDANYMLNGKPIVAIRKGGRLTYQGQDVTDQVKPYVAPPTTNPADHLIKVEHKDPTTGRTVIEWLPAGEVRGKTFQKGASGASETRLESAQAVTQTGNDIIASMSDPAIASKIGPVLGRYGSLREFIGNPPPEFAELAGQIESFAIANMGVHGMRNMQGAEEIKKLVDGHHTAESLTAGVRGLMGFSNHFLQNEGRGAAAATSSPAGETPEQRSARLRKAAGL